MLLVCVCVSVFIVSCRHLSSAPFDKDLVCSCYGVVAEGRSQIQCGLWRIQEEEGPVQSVANLEQEGGNFRWYIMHITMLVMTNTICSTVQYGTQHQHHN